MNKSNWNRDFQQDLAKNASPELRRQVLIGNKKRKAEAAKWKKGDLARFSNNVIGRVTKVCSHSLMIRIGMGRPQKYSPKMVTKVVK